MVGNIGKVVINKSAHFTARKRSCKQQSKQEVSCCFVFHFFGKSTKIKISIDF
jgi:hypothetical protein